MIECVLQIAAIFYVHTADLQVLQTCDDSREVESIVGQELNGLVHQIERKKARVVAQLIKHRPYAEEIATVAFL